MNHIKNLKGFVLILTILISCEMVLAQGPPPAYEWVKQAEASQGESEVRCSVTDSQGNTYVAGSYWGIISLDSYFLPEYDLADHTFVAKYDADGNVQWVTTAQGNNMNKPGAITLDTAGNIHIIGFFKDSISFGSYIAYGGFQDIYIASFTNSGVARWVISGHSQGYSQGFGIDADVAGNIYFTGRCVFSFTLGGLTIPTDPLLSTFIGKVNNQGQAEWLKGCSNFYIDGITATEAGTCVVSGRGNPNQPFPPVINSQVMPGQGSFLAKFNSSGSLAWHKPSFPSGSIARDVTGNFYIASGFTDTITLGPTSLISSNFYDVLISKYSPDGQLIWASSVGGPGGERGTAIVLDKANNIYVQGISFSGDTQFGNEVVVNYGLTDVFVLKTDSVGELLWVKGLGGPHYEYSGGIGVDAAGNCYISGTYDEVLYLGGTAIWTAFRNHFLARLGDYILSSETPVTEQQLSVWPNPFNNIIQVSVPGTGNEKVRVMVSDMMGRTLYEQDHNAINNQLILHPAYRQPSGFYLLTIQYKDQFFRHRLVKQ